MENARKHYGLSEHSPLLTVPEGLRVRCHRTACMGGDCPNWKLCGPVSPFSSYLANLPRIYVVGREKEQSAPSISA